MNDALRLDLLQLRCGLTKAQIFFRSVQVFMECKWPRKLPADTIKGLCQKLDQGFTRDSLTLSFMALAAGFSYARHFLMKAFVPFCQPRP